MDNVLIRGRRGTLHFIRFPTSHMGKFLELARNKGMANLVSTVCATGGGAFKFEDDFRKVGIFLLKLFLVSVCLFSYKALKYKCFFFIALCNYNGRNLHCKQTKRMFQNK